MRFHFLASQGHFSAHLRPIWSALDEADRGDFGNTVRPRPGEAIVTAAISDFRRARSVWPGFPVILFEHGVGFSFHGGGARLNGSYAGGPGRTAAALLPATNEYVRRWNSEVYPGIRQPLVGCPKLDDYLRIPKPAKGDVIAIGFHWDAKIAPETRWALPNYRRVMERLAQEYEGRIIGTGHPRGWKTIRQFFTRFGIPTVSDFTEVIARASVYCNDASSTLYEFAALGRPVVTLNAPWYRRHIHHGLRFWEHADVGVQVEGSADLLRGIERALVDAPEQQARRAAAIEAVYPYLGHASARAVEVLQDWAEARERMTA